VRPSPDRPGALSIKSAIITKNEVTQMRPSPTKLLHGLLYTAPVLLLTLAACGGGGGGGPDVTLTSAYDLSVSVTGVSGVSLVVRNGGDNLTFTSPGTKKFAHSVIASANYNVTVLTQPRTPPQLCTFTGSPSGPMPVGGKTVAVNCVNAFAIDGTIKNVLGNGLTLQNNGGDNLPIAASGVNATQSYTFNTPVLDAASYVVAVLNQPKSPAQTCTPTSTSGTVSSSDVLIPLITCVTNPPPASPPNPDRFAYVANLSSNSVWAYAASGVPTSHTSVSTGTGSSPYSITADHAGKHLYVANSETNTISTYSINTSDGTLTLIQTGVTTGSHPRSIAITSSDQFAYVTNYYPDNSVSAYIINAATGALSSIDSDGSTTAYETSITTQSGPTSLAIDPTGPYVYVANSISGTVSVFKINVSTGALTAIPVNGTSGGNYISTASTPSSATIAPSGTELYVTNAGSGNISHYGITLSNGSLNTLGTYLSQTGGGAKSIAVHPSGKFAYVANPNTNSVWVYTIDGTGALTLPTSVTTGTLNKPASISIDSTGQYAYVANFGSTGTNGISVYKIDYDTGTGVGSGGLTPVGNADTGNAPNSVITAP